MAVLTRPPHSRSFEEQVLIKEARRLRRRRWVLGAVVVLAVGVVAVAAVLAAVLFGRPTTTPTPSPEPKLVGATATVRVFGKGSAIWSIDMVDQRVGFAVAGVASKTRDAYLVATSDGGHSWVVRSVLPYGVTDGSYSQPTLVFTSASTGYTEAGSGRGVASNRHVYVTSNGGATWRPLEFSGYTPSFASQTILGVGPDQSFQVGGDAVSLVALQCTPTEMVAWAANFCPSMLFQYRLGSTRPFAARPIPYFQDADTRFFREPLSDRLLAAFPASTVIVGEGGGSGDVATPSAITTNGGITWARWKNPCDHLAFRPDFYSLPVQSLQVTAQGTWLLTCYQGGGMQQGLMFLALSRDRGTTWTVVSKASESGSEVGSLGDFDEYLWTSNNGRVLWAWSPVVNAMTLSTDAGRTWHYPSPEALGCGGRCLGVGPPGVVISPVGPSGAVLVGSNGMAFRTQNGAVWRSIRLLPLK